VRLSCRRVHITKQTLDFLGDKFEVEQGEGGNRDAYLADHKVESYLIVPPKPAYTYSVPRVVECIEQNDPSPTEEKEAKVVVDHSNEGADVTDSLIPVTVDPIPLVVDEKMSPTSTNSQEVPLHAALASAHRLPDRHKSRLRAQFVNGKSSFICILHRPAEP